MLVAITEMDAQVGPTVTSALLAQQGNYYRDLFNGFRDFASSHPGQLFSVSVWGLDDGELTSAGEPGAPVIFDADLQAKPAYYGIVGSAPPPLTAQQITGAWYDPVLTGSGFNVTLSPYGLLVYYYGWDKAGNRLWLSSDLGPASVTPGNALAPLNMYETHNGSFDAPAAPGTKSIWGTIQLNFSSETQGTAILAGADGTLTFNMTRLLGMSSTSSVTGAWYDPTYDGSGFNLLMSDSGLLLYYYGWDKAGNRLWLSALSGDTTPGKIVAGTPIAFNLVETNGGTFNAPALPGTQTPWGTLQLNFSSDSSGNCDKATATLDGKDGKVTLDMGMLVGVLNMPPGC
jgi:hypothetical protein